MSISIVGLPFFDESRTGLVVDDPAIRRRKMFNCEHLIRIVVEISRLHSESSGGQGRGAVVGVNAWFRYHEHGAGALQHIEPQHPPDKEYCNNCPCDMNDPVASCFRFAEIEHDGIVARAQTRLTLTTFCFGCTDYQLTLELSKNRHNAHWPGSKRKRLAYVNYPRRRSLWRRGRCMVLVIMERRDSLSVSRTNVLYILRAASLWAKMGAFRLRPVFWVHRLRTTKIINTTTTIVPTKP